MHTKYDHFRKLQTSTMNNTNHVLSVFFDVECAWYLYYFNREWAISMLNWWNNIFIFLVESMRCANILSRWMSEAERRWLELPTACKREELQVTLRWCQSPLPTLQRRIHPSAIPQFLWPNLPFRHKSEKILKGVRDRLAISTLTPTRVFIMKNATPGTKNSARLQVNTTTVQNAEYTPKNCNKNCEKHY